MAGPPRLLGVLLGGLLQRSRDLAGTSVLRQFQREAQDCEPVRRKLRALLEDLGQRVRIGLARYRQRILHVGAQVGGKLGIRGEGLADPLRALLDRARHPLERRRPWPAPVPPPRTRS